MKLYKVSELAEMFHMNKKTIRAIIRSKDLKFVRVGKGQYRRIPETELEHFVQDPSDLAKLGIHREETRTHVEGDHAKL